MDAQGLTNNSVEAKLIDLDDQLQVQLYDRFATGQITAEQFQIIMQKFELWQALSRELTEAVSSHEANPSMINEELHHLALLADHASRIWARYGKEICDGWRQLAAGGDLLSATIGAAPEAQELFQQPKFRDPGMPPSIP